MTTSAPTSTFAAARRLAPIVLSARDRALGVVAVGCSLAQSLADWVVAVLLFAFLHSLGVVEPTALPRWVPPSLAGRSALEIWIALFGFAALQSALQVGAQHGKVMLLERVHKRLRSLLAYRILLLPSAAPAALSRLNYLTSEIFPRTAGFFYHSLQIAGVAVQAAALAGAMLYVAPGDALVGLLGLGALGALVLRFNRSNNRAGAKVLPAQRAFERTKVRISRNWLLIRALRLEQLELQTLLDHCAAIYRNAVRAAFFGSLGGALGPVLSVALLALVVLVHVELFHHPAADLIAFLYLLFRFQQMVAGSSYLIGGLFSFGNHVKEAARFVAEFSESERNRALSMLATRGEPTGDVSRESGGRPPRISARGLAFEWPGAESPVFADLDLELAPGEQLAAVGANGSGKSTFLAILLGTLPTTRGHVLLDGVDSAVWIARHRAAVGFVGAEPYLVEGSIRCNLTYGLSRDCDDGELWEILERVGVADRVERLTNGLDHRIEENGDGLSAGEKQKLAIARALLRRALLLVLDEPTANVDEDSERDIVETLRSLKGRATVVVVSHRPAALVYSDRTFDFDRVAGSASARSDEARAPFESPCSPAQA